MIFHKTVSSGNDFIHIDLTELNQTHLIKGELAKHLCGRKTGIGADGVVYYTIRNKIVNFEIFNRDGTEAELSGNGMAGLSAVLFDLNKFEGHILIKTLAGEKKVRYLKKTKKKYTLMVEIGEPDFQNKKFFPFLQKNKNFHTHNNVKFHPVSVGNPHIVILLQEKLSEKEMESQGYMLENAKIFPYKTNIEYVLFTSEKKCRVFYHERGVGKTLSSSTGNAAVFSILKRLKLVKNELFIQTPVEEIKILGKKKIYLENSTKIVYKGIYF